QLVQAYVEVVDAQRVRQYRYATGVRNQLDSPLGSQRAARHKRRAADAQVSIERLLNRVGVAPLDQSPGNVRPARRRLLITDLDRRGVNLDPQLRQPLEHCPAPLDA